MTLRYCDAIQWSARFIIWCEPKSKIESFQDLTWKIRNVYPDISFDFKDLAEKSGSAISKLKVSNHDDFIEFTVRTIIPRSEWE